jgi:hypothetical protein
MNPIEKKMPHDEDDRFDRLADGELSESDRRALLASLDARPEGWRRCALAFLEAQTWRESLGEMTTPARKSPALPPVPPAAAPRKPRAKKPLGAMGTVLAMAASFLLFLGLGSWALRGKPWGKTGVAPTNPIAVVASPSAAPLSPSTESIAEASPQLPSSVNPSPAMPWKWVQLKAPGLTGNNEPLQLPAVERDRLDDDFFASVPNPLSNEVLQALKRTGNEVRIHRELVPVQLQDGRRLIVPVDQVEVQYDGNRAN